MRVKSTAFFAFLGSSVEVVSRSQTICALVDTETVEATLKLICA